MLRHPRHQLALTWRHQDYQNHPRRQGPKAAAEAAKTDPANKRKVPGPSVAYRWIEASASLINPATYGFDKPRLFPKVSRTMNRIRMQQRPPSVGSV